MAAIFYVFTIRRAAHILGRDEDLLWDLSDQLEPEDGKLWVHDTDGVETLAFSDVRHRDPSRNHRGSDRSQVATVELIAPTVRCSPYALGPTAKLAFSRARLLSELPRAKGAWEHASTSAT